MLDANTPMSHFEFDALRGVGRVELSLVKDQRVYALFGSNGVGKTKCLEALFQYFLVGCKLFQGAHLHSAGAQLFVAQSYRGSAGKFEVPQDAPFGFRPTSSEPILSHSLPVVYLGAGQRGHIEGKSSAPTAIGTFEERRQRYFTTITEGMSGHFSSLGMQPGLEQWFVTLAQSANPYQKIGDNRKIEIDTLLQLLHQVDERYDPNFMQIDGANRVSLKIESRVTELQHLSTGFTSLLKILQAIISGYANFTNEVNLARVRGVVLIDEIESHLHVAWQGNIVTLLKQLFPNTTFYLATHSPVVLSQLKQGEAYLLERDGDGIVRSHEIVSPNTRAFADVLEGAFGLDLNQLKRRTLEQDDQAEVKRKLLSLLHSEGGGA